MREEVRNRFRQIALPDEFLDAGALPTLHDRYGLSTSEVAKTIRLWVGSQSSIGQRGDAIAAEFYTIGVGAPEGPVCLPHGSMYVTAMRQHVLHRRYLSLRHLWRRKLEARAIWQCVGALRRRRLSRTGRNVLGDDGSLLHRARSAKHHSFEPRWIARETATPRWRESGKLRLCPVGSDAPRDRGVARLRGVTRDVSEGLPLCYPKLGLGFAG